MNDSNATSDVRYNIFHWATSELTQDALLCWVFVQYNENNAAGLIARALIKLMVPDDALPEKIEVRRQFSSIDVLLVLDYGQYKRAIVIEDKIEALLNNDLEKYCNAVQLGQKETRVVILRTGDGVRSQETGNLPAKEGVNISYVKRQDLMKLMTPYIEDIRSSEILYSFYLFLMDKEKDSQYTIESLLESRQNPQSPQWKRFYDDLLHEVVDGTPLLTNWHYVANPQGGFMCGLIGPWKHAPIMPSNVEYPIYMQIESVEGRICLKIGEVEDRENRCDIRNRVYQAVEEFEVLESSVLWERPSRLRAGACMTVAVLPPERWLVGTKDDVVARLSGCIRWYERFLSFLKEKALREKER